MLPRWLIGFRALALASAFAAAFVPIATYITDDKRDWLWIHIGVNIAAYIAVALTTIYTTISLTQQDQNKYRVPAYWANNVIMRTWYLGVSRTWRWHVAAAVGRLGLALAAAQYLNISGMVSLQGIFTPFFYISYTLEPPQAVIGRSQWETALMGLIILCLFAVLEVGLLAALTGCVCSVKSVPRYKAVLTALGRFGMIAVVVGLMSSVQYQFQAERLRVKDLNTYSYLLNGDLKELLRQLHRVAFPLLDDGTMLAAEVMRPLGNGQNGTYGAQEVLVLYEGIPSYYEISAYDNRGSVLVTLLRVLIAAVLYGVMIVICLSLAHYLHWRREQALTPSTIPNS